MFKATQYALSDEARDAAIAWFEDCTWQDVDFDFNSLNDDEVVAALNRHFDGGYSAFLKTIA